MLKLATVWGKTAVREVAIQMLAGFAQEDPIARLIICLKYEVLLWLVPAVNKLAQRASHIDFADVGLLEALGALEATRLALKISWVREAFVGQQLRVPVTRSSTGSQSEEYYGGPPGKCGVFLDCKAHNMHTACLGDGS